MAQRSADVVQYLAKQQPKKLFHILNQLKDFGVGRKVTRTIWKQDEPDTLALGSCHWTITRVQPDQVSLS